MDTLEKIGLRLSRYIVSLGKLLSRPNALWLAVPILSIMLLWPIRKLYLDKVKENRGKHDVTLVDGNSSSSNLEENGIRKKERNLKENKSRFENLVALRKEALAAFYAAEGARTKLLLEKKTNFGTTYLLGVRKPTKIETEVLRDKIASWQNQFKITEGPVDIRQKMSIGEERLEFDKWMTTTIDRDDPFGVEGKKIILIVVPDDPGISLKGFTYPTDDFDAEVEKMNGESGSVSPLGLKKFTVDENGELDRFSAFIVK